MSEAQTQAWEADDYIDDNGGRIKSITADGEEIAHFYDEHARDLAVACVNACAGVEHLWPGAVAEMVEALRGLEAAATRYWDEGGDLDAGEELIRQRYRALALLARLEAPAHDR